MTPVAFLLGQNVPTHLFKLTHNIRSGYASPKAIFLLSCILSMFIISAGYKGTLLSMLVKKEYEQPIDTVQHLVEDGRPLYIPSKTSIFSALRDDSRESVKLIMKSRSKAYRFAGGFPTWVVKSYVIIYVELLFFHTFQLGLLTAC